MTYDLSRYMIAPAMRQMAQMGQGGDTEVGHLTPGEIVVPKSAMTPAVLRALKGAFKSAGLDMGRYVVGGADDSANPETGARQFYDVAGDGSDKDEGAARDGTGTTGGNMGGGFGGQFGGDLGGPPKDGPPDPSREGQTAQAHRESEDRSMAVMDQMGKYGLGFGELDGIIGGTMLGMGMRGMMGLRGMAERAGMDVKDTAPGTGEPDTNGPDGRVDPSIVQPAATRNPATNQVVPSPFDLSYIYRQNPNPLSGRPWQYFHTAPGSAGAATPSDYWGLHNFMRMGAP